MRLERSAAPALGPSSLVRDYLAGSPDAVSLFSYHPFKPESLAARATELTEWTGDRRLLAATLGEFNAALGAGADAQAAARRLGEPGALAVVTGQQAGIFGGPAYSVFKAITAIRLARRAEAQLGVAVVPVFWIAAEDHDFGEISWTEVPAGEGLARLAVSEAPGRKASVGHLPLSPEIPALIDALAGHLPPSDFRDEVLAALRRTAAAEGSGGDVTYADWFGRLMAWIFAGTGLVFANPLLPGIRRLQAPFFEPASRLAPAVGAALEAGYARLAARRYEPTVERAPGSLYLFAYHQGERLALHYEGDRVWLRDQPEVAWQRGELADLAAREPERFSPNVVLRPVSQGFAFPDLAYIGGPGEISYLSLYQDVFAVFGRRLPVVHPRLAATLVEPPLARYLEKQSLGVADVCAGLQERRQALLAEQDPIGIAAVFDRYREALEREAGALLDALAPLGPNLAQQGDEHRRQLLLQAGKLQDKALQQHRRNCEVLLKQLDRLEAQLAPHGRPQDRSLSIVPFLSKYGTDLVRRLAENLELLEPWQHQVVYLGTDR